MKKILYFIILLTFFLLVPDVFGNDIIIEYSFTIGENGVPGTDNYHFNQPHVAAVDAEGKIYITDSKVNDRVMIYFPDLTFYGMIGGTGVQGSDNYHFQQLGSVSIGPDQKIYVSDMYNQRVQIYNPDLTYFATLGETGVSGSDNYHFNKPQNAFVDEEGKIYVADMFNHRVQIYNVDRTYLDTLTGFTYPSDIAVGPDDKIYVADYYRHRIQIFNPDRTYFTIIGETDVLGNDNDHLEYPGNVYVDSDGLIYVTDGNNQRIQIFSPDRTYLTTLGETDVLGYDNYHFNGPWGIFVDENKRLFVPDVGNYRVQVYNVLVCDAPTDGMVITENTTFCPGTYNLNTGISITTSNIELDCNGANLIGPGTDCSDWSCTGVHSEGTSDSTIKNCIISNFKNGIEIDRGSNNFLINNTVKENKETGIGLYVTNKNVLKNNSMLNNMINLGNSGSGPGDYSYEYDNDVDTSNTVNGKPVIYINGKSDFVLDGNYTNHITIGNGHNIIVKNIKIDHGDRIQIGYSTNVTISDNEISSNAQVITLHWTTNSLVTRNYLKDNRFAKSEGVIFLFRADDNIVRENYVINNDIGIGFWRSGNNVIYHNNFINNTPQVLDMYPTGTNYMYSTSLLEGNYWSDYTGLDDGSGTGKHAVTGDGIGDTNIPHQEDYYPYMKSNWWIPLDSDGDSVSDSMDACPTTYGVFCNGCPEITCLGCAISHCPNTGEPYCVADNSHCLPTVCPKDGCGVGSCFSNQTGKYTPTDNICELVNNEGTCTNNPCTLTCTFDKVCEMQDEISILKQQLKQTQDKVSILETTINNLIQTVNNIQTSLTGFITKVINYLSYLPKGQKKDMVCGYMLNNNITEYSDLGLTCKLIQKDNKIQCKCSPED